MIKFTYADGENICEYDGEKATSHASIFIEKYKRNATESARLKEWKKGENALFRGETDMRDGADPVFNASVEGVFPTAEDGKVVYAFSVNDACGIYRKDLNDEKKTEAHVINSNDKRFSGGCLDVENNILATSLQKNYFNSDIALFDLNTDDYKTVTDGDTLDVDPFISPDEPNIIYYSSRGAGRDANGEFIKFSPAAVYRLDMDMLDVRPVIGDDKHNYFKPVRHGGKLYCIKAPVREKRGNPLLEIILIPYRILQAIVGFFEVFVRAFTGKSLAGGGNNPTKARDYDSRKTVIAGNLINVEKNAKKNASKKNPDYGFMPSSWKIIDVDSGKSLAEGVADFDIAEDGTIVYTNGRRIFTLKDGVKKKVCNAERCFRVSCIHRADKKPDSPFGF